MKFFLLLGLCWLFSIAALFAQGDERPQSNVFVILKTPDSRLQVVRAKKLEIKTPNFLLTDEKGRVFERSLNIYIDSIAFFTDEFAQGLSVDDFKSLLSEYDNLIRCYPELEKPLLQDRNKFQGTAVGRKLQFDELEENRIKELKQFTGEPFVDESDYTLEQVSQKITVGTLMRTLHPEEAEIIDVYLKPWRQRQNLLSEGRIRYEGEWYTVKEAQELHADRRAERLEVFVDKELKPFVISNTVIERRGIITLLIVWSVGIVAALGIACYGSFHKRFHNWLWGSAWAVSVAFLIFTGYCLTRVMHAPRVYAEYKDGTDAGEVSADAKASLDQIHELLFICRDVFPDEFKQDDFQMALSQDEINTALDRYLDFRSDTIPGSAGLRASKLRVLLHPNKISFLQQTACFKREFLLRYDLYLVVSNDAIRLYRCDVFVGNLALPKFVGNRLWLKLFNSLQNSLAFLNVSRYYNLQKLDTEQLTLNYIFSGT